MESYTSVIVAFIGVISVFIGVIIGGSITLVTTFLTLRGNQKLHENNLREERRKIKEEREFSSKQSAFMLASEALVRFLQYYISLPYRILPDDGTVPEEFNEFRVAFNRLHFYCELETIEKLASLEQILSKAYCEALNVKMPSAFIAEELKVIDVRISGIEQMNTKVQDEIIAMIQSGPGNPLLASKYEQQAKNNHKIGDLHGQRVELIKRGYVETEKCLNVVIANMKTVNKSLSDVLLCARRELSFDIDEEHYRTFINKHAKSMDETGEKFLAEIHRQIHDKMQLGKSS